MKSYRFVSVIAMVTALFVALTHTPLDAQEKVVIGGSGSLTDEMSEVAKAYMAKHPGDAIQVLMESMSTTGGMEGVKAGRLTIGLVTRPPSDAEKAKLFYVAVGRNAVGVAVHKSLPVANLTEAQVCDMFSGRIKSWREVRGSELKVTVLTRKQDDNNTETMRKKMDCFKNLKVAADAIVLIRGSEVLDSINHRPGTVGVVNVSASLNERENVKALSIEGHAPGTESVQSGAYKYFSEKGVVTLGPAQGAAKRFLDFVVSPEGQKIMSRRGMIPLL